MDKIRRPLPNDASDGNSTSREADYRDYEERDIDDGWPYADTQPGLDPSARNEAYGETGENFDETGNPGFQTGSDAAIRSSGGPDLIKDDPDQDIADDVLEETINDILEDAEIDTSGFEVQIDEGVVTLEGEVDTADDRRRAGMMVQRVPGVREMHNRLTLRAADAGLPSDWDE